MESRYKIRYYPEALTKKKSYVRLTDLKTSQSEKYCPIKKLGSGTYGYVRSFGNGEYTFAVKAPKKKNTQNLSEDEIFGARENIKNEFSLLRMAYPNAEPYSLFHIQGNEDYSYRMVMPLKEGIQLGDYAYKRIQHPADMALLFLRVAQELLRIHKTGVIHGDVSRWNIFIRKKDHDYQVNFIDFGLASDIYGKAQVGFTTSGDLAPERIEGKQLNTHPSQDIFSFARTLQKVLSEFKTKWKEKFNNEYPSVANFIALGTNKDAQERPDLRDFIHRLCYQLDWTMISEDLYSLAAALNANDFSEVRKLIEGKQNLYTGKKLAPLLNLLMQFELYNVAKELMRYKRRIPTSTKINENNALHIAAANPDIDFNFFCHLLQYTGKKNLPNVIDATNASGETLLHLIARNGRMDLLQEILRYHPNTLIRNKSGKLAKDVAHADVKPIVQLITLISAHEKNNKNKNHMFAGRHEALNKAAHALADVCLHGENQDSLDEHLETITTIPMLHNIYQGLINKGYIQTEETKKYPSFLSMVFDV